MRDLYSQHLVSRARELRRNMTPAERKLWYDALRSHPVKFRRQVPLAGYILDFYAPSVRICIELDGASHDSPEAQAYDRERTRVLEGLGICVVRFRNEEVLEKLPAVLTALDILVKGRQA